MRGRAPRILQPPPPANLHVLYALCILWQGLLRRSRPSSTVYLLWPAALDGRVRPWYLSEVRTRRFSVSFRVFRRMRKPVACSLLHFTSQCLQPSLRHNSTTGGHTQLCDVCDVCGHLHFCMSNNNASKARCCHTPSQVSSHMPADSCPVSYY